MFDDEGQKVNNDGSLSTCSQTPCIQDAAEIVAVAQSVPEIESV